MTSCTAAWRETDPKVGDIIHANFTWTDAKWHTTGEFYCDMGIYNPDGTRVAYYVEEDEKTGSHALSFDTNMAGDWTCVISVWTGFAWLYCTDIVAVVGITCSADWRETDPKVGDLIHADFTWAYAEKHGSGIYCSMGIYNPNDVLVESYDETVDETGSHTLDFVANAGGQWTCVIQVWTGFTWLPCADIVNVALSCSGYTNKTDCEAAGCYWWNGSCHSSAPANCEALNNETDCESYDCYWWNGSCHSSAPTCGQLNNKSDCKLYGCYWYNSSCHSTIVCGNINTRAECEAHNCYWYNGSCHSSSPSCSILNNSSDCKRYGCHWWNGSCHSSAPTCAQLNNESDCKNYGCFWYNDSCHSTALICEDFLTQTECEEQGCHWYNGSCHSSLPSCDILGNQPDCERYGCYWWDGVCRDDAPYCEQLENETDCLAHSCYWYGDECHPTDQPGICYWIDDQGGPGALTIEDVFVIIDSYLFEIPPVGYGFIPTIQNVFGIIDYYMGFDGDPLTGCKYATPKPDSILAVTRSASNDPSVGDTAWSNPTNIEIEENYAENSVMDLVKGAYLTLVKGGVVQGDVKGVSYGAPTTVGRGSTDMWGLSLTPADVNADFGCVFQVKGDRTDTNYLKALNFGFTVPDEATIVGIEVVVSSSSGGVANQTFVRYIKMKVHYILPYR